MIRPNRIESWAIGILLIGAIADCVSTQYFLSHGGIEGNPLGVWLLERYGIISLYFVKAIGTALLLLLMFALREKVITIAIGAAGLLWSVTAVWNVLPYLR